MTIEVTENMKEANAVALQVFDSLARDESMKTVWGRMKTDDFINLRDFPLNRDVAKRLKSSRNVHLKGGITSSQQQNVSCVITSAVRNPSMNFYVEGAEVMKIDGHSRCQAWKDGTLAKPEYVYVQFFFNHTDLEIIKEYQVFNDSLAQATSAEHTTMFNKLNDFNPTSDFVKGSWKDAFKKMECSSYEEGLRAHSPILIDYVDTWNITPDKGKSSTRRHTTGVKIAILKTYKPGSLAQWIAFWKDFFNDESTIKQVVELREQLLIIETNKPITIRDKCADAFLEYQTA